MKEYEILDTDDAYIKRLKSESNLAQKLKEEKGDTYTAGIIKLATDIILLMSKKSILYVYTKKVVSTVNQFITTGLLSPLTLKIGEFIYTRPGLSVNRRFPAIKQNVTGIYYDEAYSIFPVEIYDVILNKSSADYDDYNHCDELSNDIERIYLSTGGLITHIYFNKAYIKKHHIDRCSWIPVTTLAMNVCKVVYKDKYINVIQVNGANFRKLDSLYNLNYEEDNNEYLENFGVTKNITKDALFGKRSTI